MNADESDAKPQDSRQEFVSEIERRRIRRQENERDTSFWSSVGMMGTVGWSVALPTAIGTLFGRWLDTRLESGYVFMIFFMLVGVGLGCAIAWRMISEKM